VRWKEAVKTRYGKGTLMTFADEVMIATTGVLQRVAYELK